MILNIKFSIRSVVFHSFSVTQLFILLDYLSNFRHLSILYWFLCYIRLCINKYPLELRWSKLVWFYKFMVYLFINTLLLTLNTKKSIGIMKHLLMLSFVCELNIKLNYVWILLISRETTLYIYSHISWFLVFHFIVLIIWHFNCRVTF